MYSYFRDIIDPLEGRFNPLPLMKDYGPNQQQWHLRSPRCQQSVVVPRAKPKADKNQFQIMVNVKHFEAADIDVKTVDNFVIIHGKHEELPDEHGYVTREFTRRYELPDDVEPSTVTSSLSPNGVLTIQAPKKVLEPPHKNERIVPIIIQQPMTYEESQTRRAQMEQQVQEQQVAQEVQEKQETSEEQ